MINAAQSCTEARQISDAPFRNSFVDEMPGDESGVNRPRQVPGVLYSRVESTPVRDPHLLAWSDELALLLCLEKPAERGPAVDVLAGNAVAPGMKPFAARYGGHQFGAWAGQLGDGRAISLGEVPAANGSFQEIQLKGAGVTPYSRRGDGRAVLRSSLREFVCSEAMFHLGVPTTRALSLVGTGEAVIRDMFYNGDPRPEPGAVVARVAPTFVRFGNFEILTSLEETDNLRLLADYVLRHHYPELGPPSEEATYLAWFEEICRRTAVMVAHWMNVGFVHGVMNTDNMSILGVTIDYGPYGWLEPYEPDWTPNTTDFGQRRYAYGQQPGVALWNLMALAHALSPLVSDPDKFMAGAECYRSTFFDTRHAMLRAKLGLTGDAGVPEAEDRTLGDGLHAALEESSADMTLFFRRLCTLPAELGALRPGEEPLFRPLVEEVSYTAPGHEGHEALIAWLHRWAARLKREPSDPAATGEGMRRVNPKYVPRNYLAQRAIEAAEAGDLSVLHTLMGVLRRPYDEQPEHDALAAKRPEWARTRPGCATLSCSS